jgi:hypothetical protein
MLRFRLADCLLVIGSTVVAYLAAEAATIGDGAGFLDLRTAIRAAIARDFIHGPRDFKHFNRKGMEVLGQAVADRIDRPLAEGPCSQLEN